MSRRSARATTRSPRRATPRPRAAWTSGIRGWTGSGPTTPHPCSRSACPTASPLRCARRAGRLPVRGTRRGPGGRGGPRRADRGRPGRGADRGGAGGRVRARPRRRPHVAAQLPGPRRPRRGERTLRAPPPSRRRRPAAAVVGVRALPGERPQGPAIPQDGARARAPARGLGELMPPARRPAATGLTVAVTGPTGEIGRSFVAALEQGREVRRGVGMARPPFDPAEHGWRKTEYRQGDVLDRAAVDALVADADVVVHLAFIVTRASERSRDVNVEGSRNVFAATVAAGVKRLVYSSSVAAYGFPEPDGPFTEDMPARGHDRFPYSAHKAEVERVLAEALAGGPTEAYVFRPCIVAGAEAPALIDAVPHLALRRRLPKILRPLPVLPDPGVPFQLVHHDDVALALRAGVLGRGTPGADNLGGPGQITMRDLAAALRMRAVPVPHVAVEATAEIVARTPFLPAQASWIEAARRPVLMDTAKARRELRWRPRHDAHETLRETVAAVVGGP